MRSNKNSFLLFSFFLILLFFSSSKIFSQATFSKATYQTLSQQEVDVQFSQNISFSDVLNTSYDPPCDVGATTYSSFSTTGWTVTVAGTTVCILSVRTFGTNIVRIKFDASVVPGHSSSEVYVKPGEAVKVSYNGTGTLTSSGGVTTFTSQSATNAWVFDCSTDIAYYQETDYASVDQCAPVVMNFHEWKYRFSLRYRNSTTWASGANTRYQINWGDGATINYIPYQSDLSGVASTTFIDPTGLSGSPNVIMTLRPSHTYPSTNPTDCSFNVNVTPIVAGVSSCPSAARQSIFATYDTDNKNSGVLATPPPLVAGTDQVCLGTNVNMMFNDNTSLNCRSAIEPVVPNQSSRWIRIVYGSQDNGGVGNIPDIRVTYGGVPVQVTQNNASGTLLYPTGYYPTGGGGNNQPDGFGVIQIPSPVTAATGTTFMATITTTDPSKQVLNQKFWVRIEYWDVCNPYSGDPTNPAPVTSSAAITIISNNSAPVISPLTFCAGQANSTYTMNATSAGPSSGGTFKWYSDAALTTLVQTGSSYNPVSSAPNLNKSPSNVTTNNFYVTETIGNGCVSPKTTVPFTIDPAVVPGTIVFSGSSPQCNGYDPPTIFGDGSSGSSTASKGDGSNYTYQWQDSPNNVTFTNISGATGLNYDPPVLTSTRYYRRVASSGVCASQNSNVITIQIDQPVNGGSIGSDQTICAGNAPATFTNTGSPSGGNGTFSYQWQSSTIGSSGPFTNITGANSSTYTSGALTQTTYFRRQTTSGVCSSGNPGFSNVITVTVNQAVVGGSIGSDQTLCSGTTPIMLTSVLAASGGDGTSYTYLWQQSTTSSSGPFTSASGANTGLTYSPPALTQTTYYRRQATSGVCSAGFSNAITITVNPLPTAANPTGGGSVCSGNPAPDIVWALTGTAPYTGTWTDGTSTYNFSESGVSQTATELRISSPKTLNGGTYKILSLTDANGCVATALGGTATITIGGTAPSLNAGSALSISNTCFNGTSTSDPTLVFSLDAASASNGPFTLVYNIDGGSNRTKTFNTDAGSNPTTPIIFSDTELNSVTPSPHVINVVSLQSPFGCQTVLTNSYNFTVNTLPSAPLGAVNGVACSNPGTGVPISVTSPGGGLEIGWSTTSGTFTNAVPGSGSVGASPFNVLTPATSATATYYAFTKNASTGCYSSTSLAVTQTQDNKPNSAVAGSNQIICSSTSTVTLAATPATNSGTGTWTVLNKVAYYQNFENFSTGTTSSAAQNGWSRDVSGANAFPQQGGGGYFEVKAGKRFEAQNTNGNLGTGVANLGEVVWTSSTIDISGLASATASVDVINVSNNLTAGADADYVKVSYKLNGGAETTFPTNGNLTGNFSNATATVTGLTGSTLVIIVRVSTNAATETVAFDNVTVKDASASTITFSDANSPTSTVTGLPAPPPGGTAIVSTLRWTVASSFGVCSTSFSDMTVTINPLPTSTDPAPQLCEDVAGGGSHAAVDLTSFNSSVTNAPTVAWFTDAAHTSAVGTPTSVTVNNSSAKTFYFVATSAASCTNSGTLTFTVNALPQATNQNLSFCEDLPVGSNQHAGINLTSYTNAITGGAANRTVAWFSDAALTSSIGSPTNYTLIGTQTVYAKVTNTVSGCVNKATVSLVLKPLPQDNPITGNATVCANSTTIALYQVDPTKNPGSNYTWNVSAVPAGAVQVFGGGGTNSSNFFVLVKFPIAGTVTITMVETLNGCSGNTSTFTINVNNAPSAISINGLTEVCTNQSGVVYSVPSANASSTYTWTASGATFPGASSGVGLSTVTVDYGLAPSATIGVTETSSTGCVGSPASININVNSRPSMTSVNASTTCSNTAPTLVFTSSLPSTYSWTVSSITGTLTGTSVGATGSGDINSLITNKSGATGFVTYSVVPSATAAPNCSGTAQSVTLTVNPEPVLVSPQTKTICSGQAVGYEIQLTPATLPSGTVFSWPDPDGAGPATAGTNVAAGASGTIHINDVLTNTTSLPITVNYVVSPVAGSCTGTPVTIAITVNPEPFVANGLDATKCSDTSIGLSLSTDAASVAAANYNIISKTVAGGLTGAVGNAIVPSSGVSSNYLSNDQYTNTTAGPLTVIYRVAPVSAAGCVGATKTITITINPEPVLSTSLDATVCSGLPIGVTLSTTGSSAAAGSYTIVGKSVAPGLVAGGSNAVVPASGVSDTYINNDKYTNTGNTSLTVVYQVSAVTSLGCVGNPPQAITITILPEPVVATNLNASICSGSTISLTLNTNGTSIGATDYDITAKTVDAGLVSGSSNASAPASTVPAGYLSSDSYSNTTGSPLFVTYTVVARSVSSCLSAPKVITITVNPEPVLSNSLNASSCSDVAHGLTLNTNGSSVAAATYNITARSISGGLTANVSNAAVPASGVSASYLSGDIFTNTTANPLNVTYTVVPVSSSGCLGASKVITVVINPEPVVSSSLDASVCSIAPIGLTLATNGSSVTAATYNVTNIVIAGGLTAAVGNAVVPASGVPANYLANDIYTNVGATALTVKYTVVPVSASGCLGDAKVITMTLNPVPVMSNALDATVCSNATIGLTLNTNGTSAGAANYNITSVSVPASLTAGVTNAVIPASNVVASYLTNDKYSNTGSTTQIVSYTVVPISASGCPGAAKVINITINPEPVVSNALDATVCSDLVTGLILNTDGASVAALNYNVTARTVAGGLVPAATNVTAPASAVAATYLVNDKFTNTTTLPLNVTYTVVPVSASNCSGSSKTITITINPEPVVSIGLDNTVCSDLVTGLTLSTTASSATVASYNITSRTIAGGLVANASNAIVPATAVAANYLATDSFTNSGATALNVTYTVVPVSASGCLGDPKVITMTINPAPVVSGLLDATVCSKSVTNLTLNTNGSSVAASSYNITAVNIGSGLTPGGSNATVPANGVAASYLANDKFVNTTSAPINVIYTVVPVSAVGCLGQPLNITITVSPEPVLSSALNTSTCSDISAGLILNTNGTSVAAQNYNITAITVAAGLTPAVTNATVPASGVNANYLSNDKFTNTGSSNLTVAYTVVPVSASGCMGNAVTVTITINPEPVVATNLDATVCSQAVTALVLTTNGLSTPAASYNITSINVASGLVADAGNKTIANGVAANYLAADKFTNTTGSALNVVYTVVPVSAGGCLGDPKNITIVINPEPVVATTLDKTVCSSSTIALTLATNGTSVSAASYNIVNKTAAPGLTADIANVAVPQNGVAANYLLNDKFTNVTNGPLTVVYQVIPASAAGCFGLAQNITVTINPEPVLSTSLNKVVCSDAPGGIVLNTNGTSVAAASYNITSVTVPSGLTIASAATVPQTGVAANYLSGDTYTNKTNAAIDVLYTVVPVSADGCLGSPVVVKQTVNPEPVLANLNNAACSDVVIGLTLATNGTSVTAANYNVNSISVAGGLTAAVSNAAIPVNGVTANYLFNDKFTNTGNSPLSVVYNVTPVSSTPCSGDPVSITINIQPKPVLSNLLDKTVCSQTAGGVVLNTNGTSVAASTYNITAIVIDNGLTSAAGNAIVANGVASNYLSSDKFTNTTNGNLTVHYTVVPVSAAGCLGDPLDVVLTVQPEPVIDPALAAKTVCSRDNVSLVLNTNGISVAAINYDVALVSKDAGLSGTPTVGNGLAATAIQNDNFTNTGAVPLKVIYSVTPHSAPGCLGVPFTITITVNPEPVISPGLDNTVCSKEVAGITLSTNGSVGAASYKLISVTVPGSITADAGNAVVNSVAGVSLIKNDKYINTTSAPVIVVYGIAGISASGCQGQTKTINLTINPEPILSPGFVSVCSDVASGVILGPAPGSSTITQYILKQILVPVSISAAGTNAGLGTYSTTNFLASDKFTNTTSSPAIVTYTIAPVSNGCVGNDQQVQLTVNPAPAVATDLNRLICSGGTSGIVFATTSSSVLAANYNIVSVTISAGLTQTAGNSGSRNTVTSNEIQNDAFTNSTNGVLTITYKVVPVSASNCLGPVQNIVLSVEPAIISAPVNNKPNICSSSATDIDLISPSVPSAGPITFSYTAVSSVGGQLTGFIPAASNLPANTKITDNLVNSSSNPATVIYSITAIANGAKNGSGCSSSPVNIVVTVEPTPKVAATPSIQTLCEGVASNVKLTTTTVPSAGTVQFNVIGVVPDAGLTRTSPAVAKTVYLNNEVIADTWSNSSTIVQTVTYTLQAVVSGGLGCVGNQINVTMNVNPLPNVTATSQAPICSNDLVNITLTSDVASTINNWTATVIAGSATGFSANGSGDLIFQTIKNTGSTQSIVRYTVTPKASGCVGPVIFTDVYVDPIPDILGLPSSVNVCYGGTLNVPLSSSVAGTSFAWTVDPATNFESVPATGSGSTINQVMNNSSAASDYLTYTVTATGPGATACQSSPKAMTVIAAPQMNASFLNTDTWLCKGDKDILTILLDGQAPFTLVYNDGSGDITLNKVGNVRSIQVQPTATTTFKLVSMKDALGCNLALTNQLTYTVGETNATFSVITPLAHCSPYTPVFQYNQVAGTQYTWRWGDGSPDSTYVATTSVANFTVKHLFVNPSPTQTLSPKITLETSLQAPFPDCSKTSTKSVSIYPQLKTIVSQNKTEMCSGEIVSFTNQTAGALTNTWYYREVGNTSQQIDPRSTKLVSYTMTNTTTQNPITYEVYYKADNNLCPADTTMQVKVYRAITAGFNEGTVPPFIGGNATVTFTNTSSPIDASQFRYEWNFGTDANPGTSSSTGPITVNYSSPGSRDVLLTVTNVAAETAGLSCNSTFTKTINIQLLPLIADFDASPKQSCYPSNITVSYNNSTGDKYDWRVVDQNGRVVATSNAALPVFTIGAAGKFSIILITSSSFTGQQATKTLDGFEIFDLPVAAFIARPSLVYVPDTELSTINSSINASDYLWDFGDGSTETSYEPKHTYKVEGIYDLTLVAMDDHGNGVVCKDTAQQKVIAKQGGLAKIPNAFTPNPNGPSGGAVSGSGGASGSNFNDVFLPLVKGVEEFNMQIYDRWGNLIFESNSQNVGWDGYDQNGKLLPAGVYVYKLTLRLSDNQRSTQLGDVTLIR
jgi:gliding motility-associated-like protein